MGSYFHTWFCKNTRDLQDSLNLFSLMNLCDKCRQYWRVTINFYSSSLSPPLPLGHHPLSCTHPHVILSSNCLESNVFRIHQFNVRLVLAWQPHGKLSTHCTASGMLPRKNALTFTHKSPRIVGFLGGCEEVGKRAFMSRAALSDPIPW